MKRFRDDVYVSPKVKQPAISPRVEPSGQAQMSTASSMQRLATTDALSYLKTVKEIFRDKKDKYDEFLDVMKAFKAQRIDTTGVITRVKELFKGYRDLILGFNTFLPKGYEITLSPDEEPFTRKKPVEFEEAISFVNKIKTRFQGDGHVYKAFLDILNLYRKDNKSITEVYQEVSVIFQNHADLLVEFTHFLPDISRAASFQYTQPSRNHVPHGEDKGSPMTLARLNHDEKHDTEQWNQVEKEKGEREDRENNEWKNDDGLEHKRKSARREDPAADQLHRGMEEVESAFREKVKERLQAPEKYEKISDCICSFKSKFVPAAEFRKLVVSLIGEHPDLMEACEDFITYIEKSGSIWTNKQVVRSLKVEDGDGHDREDRDKTEYHDNRERDRHDRGLFNYKDVTGQKIYASKDKSMAKPIHELDLSECESCTPSYRLLPENYPIPSASCRTEIGNQVLNDRWVSVTSGSEDYSFKHMRKNQYEESLFRCEDDRFELDMLLESVNTTVKHVEELLDRMNAQTTKADSSFNIEECLSALSLRCIERLYGDHGIDVMDVLRKNAPLALPVILTRLKQKQEEWARCRADFNKVWADIYAKNYHKSLDHRSFYFKQQDTKNLSAKALLAEIKEIGEKNQYEDESLLASIGAGYKQPIKPDMVFEYPDPEIHEDLYQLMKYSCGEICVPEQCDKVMKAWTMFLEQVMGVPSRSSTTKEKEVADKENGIVKKSVENIPEENGSSIDGSPADGNIGNKGDVFCDAPENGQMQIGATMMSAIKQASFLEEGTSSSVGVKDIKEEDLSVALKGPDYAVAACGTVPTPSQGTQEGVKKHNEESEDCTRTEREEGELSPNQNPGEIDFPLFVDNCTKDEITVVADEEGEESLRVSSDSENVASENGDNVFASESANGDDCSPGRNDDNVKAEGSEGEGDVLESEGEAQFADRFLRVAKPLAVWVPMGSRGGVESRGVFYGNDSFYLLFRLHQMLYHRMLSAKLHSSSSENRWRISNGANQIDSYAGFKDALRSLLNGSFDNAKFEDECRAIIGAQSYVLFTLDKLIHKLVKQLQTIASDEMDNKLLQLYSYERSRNPKIFSGEVYHVNARFLLPDDNLYRIECLPCPMHLTIQLMRTDHDKFEPFSVSMDPEFAAYLNNELFMVLPERMGKAGVYLKRNKRKLYNGDENSDFEKAMEGLVIHNGLEMKVNSVTKKIAYVLDTEDFFYRTKARRQVLYQLPPHGAPSGTSNANSQTIKCCKLPFS